MSKGIVLSLFDFTGNMVKPWADAGYLCYCVDMQHESEDGIREGNIVKVKADINDYLPPRYLTKIVFGFPPCTHLACSGARWMRSKGPRKMRESIEIFARAMEIAEWIGAPYLIENPRNIMTPHVGPPQHKFDPCDYAGYLQGEERANECYTKETWLWTGGGFVMPKRKRLHPKLGSKMHLLPPSADRANLRSETPKGFAKAVFIANEQSPFNEATPTRKQS